MFEYSDIISFVRTIEDECKQILDYEKNENSNFADVKNQAQNCQVKINNFETVKKLAEADPSPKVDEQMVYATSTDIYEVNKQNLLMDFGKTKEVLNDVNNNLSSVKYWIPFFEAIITKLQERKKIIENHPKYNRWCNKQRKYFQNNPKFINAPAGMTDDLVMIDTSFISRLMDKTSSPFKFNKTKQQIAYLNQLYNSSFVDENSILTQYIRECEKAQRIKNRIDEFKKYLTEEINKNLENQNDILNSLNNTIDEYPSKIDSALSSHVNKTIDNANSSIDSVELRNQLYDLNNSYIDWKTGKLKDISEEKYVFSNHKGYFKYLADTSSIYIQRLKNMLLESYGYFIKEEDDDVSYIFPDVVNINTTSFNYVIDCSNVCEMDDNVKLNSLVQNFVATTLANFPTGKTKFLFCDPDNTGVFSIFRDIGKIKDNINESVYCQFASSENDITNKLDSICIEIGDTVNKTLKGTKTTLYSHNKDNEFNNLPYKFIMIMDFPRKMSPSALESLRTIMKDGPRCGVFTVLVKAGGDAMDLLKDAPLKIANEIIRTPALVYKNGSFYDTYENTFGNFTEEINVDEFDKYTQIYNKRAKNDVQIVIDIDSFDSSVVDNGRYKVPIGRSKGGNTEDISFFDHCQNYLLSGAIGRGKSNALHVIIHNSLKFVRNLDLYLIDFKHGVEFAPYAKLNNPAFKVLAIESAPEFGYSVLSHIKDKIEKISDIFREHGVENWNALYEKTGIAIPVTLVIMDEFQHIFEGEHGKDCSDIIEFIAKEGRVFNVHLLLSSQTTNTLAGLTEQAKQQIFGRIVFYNNAAEYKAMLWDDDSLAKTLNQDIKGQAILASDKEHQKFVQFALKKPIEQTIEEFNIPVEESPNRTKIMLSAVNENPYSIYNKFLSGDFNATADCELVIGDEISIEKSDIKSRLDDPDYRPEAIIHDINTIQLRHRQNDNVLIIGNHESKAETIFMFSLICTLMRQVTEKKTNSISLIIDSHSAPTLYNFATKFPKYIKIYTTSDILTEAVSENTDYLFVFGLHAFSSMKFAVDDPYKKIAAAPTSPNGITFGSNAAHHSATYSYSSDGEMFREALDAAKCNVIVWHNDVNNLANMFGNTATFPSFNNKFIHKIGLPMNQDDSCMFMGTDCCSKLSNFAIIYKLMNNELVLRMYNRFESKYLNEITRKLLEIADN